MSSQLAAWGSLRTLLCTWHVASLEWPFVHVAHHKLNSAGQMKAPKSGKIAKATPCKRLSWCLLCAWLAMQPPACGSHHSLSLFRRTLLLPCTSLLPLGECQ